MKKLLVTMSMISTACLVQSNERPPQSKPIDIPRYKNRERHHSLSPRALQRMRSHHDQFSPRRRSDAAVLGQDLAQQHGYRGNISLSNSLSNIDDVPQPSSSPSKQIKRNSQQSLEMTSPRSLCSSLGKEERPARRTTSGPTSLRY